MSRLQTRARRLQSRLLSGYWFVPTSTVLVISGLAYGLLAVDRRIQSNGARVGFNGGPGSARELLSAIASSMMTLTALVFSVTILVLQLASSQFSPRVLRTFLRDLRNQLTLGVFLSTFVYALLVLREIRGDDVVVDQFVPGVAISFSVALVILSVGLFVQYIHNIAISIRVIEIISRVRGETVRAIERLDNSEEASDERALPSGDAVTRSIAAKKSGVLASLDLERLCQSAEAADVTFAVVPRPGDFVACGMPLVVVHGTGDTDDDDVRAAVSLDKERDPAEDPAFGLRQIVDIAERSLSPGVNDQTTATQCLDQLHDLLRRLASRPLLARVACGPDGTVRVVAPQPGWDDYVRFSLDEVRHWGASSVQVHRRIRSLLADLLTVVEPERAAVLHDQRRLLDARLDDLPPTERVGALGRVAGG